MVIKINSRTAGGTSYLTRILKAATTHNHIDIVILTGAAQKRVYESVNKQLDLLHQVTDVHFTHTVTQSPSGE